jgi:hypothetical protein
MRDLGRRQRRAALRSNILSAPATSRNDRRRAVRAAPVPSGVVAETCLGARACEQPRRAAQWIAHLAVLLVALAAIPALAQDSTAPGGLPQGSKVGTVHRDAKGRIVAEPPSAAPAEPAAPASSPAMPRAVSAPAASQPAASKPAAPKRTPAAQAASDHPVAGADIATEKAAGPESWDDASCKAYQWEASLKYDECRKRLAEARAHETDRAAQ